MSVSSVVLYTGSDVGICLDCEHALLCRGAKNESDGVICKLSICRTGWSCTSYVKRDVQLAMPDLLEGINSMEAFGIHGQAELRSPYGVIIFHPDLD